MATAALNDIATTLGTTKNKRSDDARATVNVGGSLISGEAVSNARLGTKIAKRLNINRGRVSKGFQHRTKILRGEKRCWTYTECKTRSDALSEEVRKLVHNFWAGPEVSHRTGNKKDTIRKRIAPKVYVQHEKQILEMTQTEVFLAYKRKYPDVKIGQRAFEKCKPCYVTPPRMQDRNLCYCRVHVDMCMAFKSWMDFRKKNCRPKTTDPKLCLYMSILQI